MSAALIKMLDAMKHSPLGNYGGIPGLTSWLIGTPSANGLVRLMECSRDHDEPIIPHSHRFDFHCTVLAGRVCNVLWTPDVEGDQYLQSTLSYGGEPGTYLKTPGVSIGWEKMGTFYHPGDEYEMHANQVHSIFFGRGTKVLFFEGPQISSDSIILEPMVDGVVVPTFDVKPWAFQRGGK